MAILRVLTLNNNGEIQSREDLKDPQTLQWDSVDLEADGCSGYNQMGEYFRDVIGKKMSLSVTWGMLTDAELSGLLDKIKGDSFILEYPDAALDKRVMTEVYVSSRTAPMYCYYGGEPEQSGALTQADEPAEDEEKKERWKWQGFSVTFMEV